MIEFDDNFYVAYHLTNEQLAKLEELMKLSATVSGKTRTLVETFDFIMSAGCRREIDNRLNYFLEGYKELAAKKAKMN